MAKPLFTSDGDEEGTQAPAEAPQEGSALRSIPKPDGWAADRNFRVEVLDTTAKMLDGKTPEMCARPHTIIVNNQHYTHRFLPGMWLEMPIDHGMKFIRHPEFLVREAGKEELLPRPLDIQDMLRPIDPGMLPADQTVAQYSEMTADALLIRCKMAPGGEVISNKSGKAAMVDFLVQTRKAAMAQRRREQGIVEKNDPNFLEMSDEQMRRMLPEEEAA